MLLVGEADLEIEVSTQFLNKMAKPEIISSGTADNETDKAQQQEKVDQLKHKALN